MRKLVLQKSEAQPLVEFLQKPELKNKVARLRNKLVKKLTEIVKETDEERIELCKEHSDKDKNGEAIVNDNQYQVQDLEALNADLQELYAEEVAIEVGEYSNNFEPLFEHLESDEFDYLLSGKDDACYNRLLDIWEDAMEDKEEEK
jgi:seryl-tRNA synthetase